MKRYEIYFKNKGLPCVFRIPSFSNNQKLDSYLQEEGYRYVDRSLVLCRALTNARFDPIEITEKSSNDWLSSYCEINEIARDSHAVHLEMIQRIKDRTLLAVLKEDDLEVACGLGVISNRYVGLFDITTKKNVRQQGYGTQLLNAMFHWAVKHGATRSYLQVVADNKAAINLYEKFEYKLGYEYWYRIRDLS